MVATEREDGQSETWISASKKLNLSGKQQILVRSFQPDVVEQKMNQLRPNVIVIDRRRPSSSSNPDALCR